MPSYSVTVDGYTFDVEVDERGAAAGEVRISVDGQPVRVRLPEVDAAPGEIQQFLVEGRPYEVAIDQAMKRLLACEGELALEIREAAAALSCPAVGGGQISAPIPGRISQVMAQPGQHVQAGQTLLVLEAMKMENQIRAACSGLVQKVHVAAGQSVGRGDILVELG